MRPGLPGGKVMTVKREPFSGGAVPSLRAPQSSTFSPIGISQGVLSVDQISVEVEPAFPPLALVAGPSIITLATLFLSWPVTTRRIGGNSDCSAISFPFTRVLLLPRRSVPQHGRCVTIACRLNAMLRKEDHA